MKQVLALDGGGIRGVFSLGVLRRMQELLREHYDRPDLVLADHYDFFAGTSTGAIIATCLCWGMTVEAILDLYVKFGGTMFTPVPWYRPFRKFLVSRYETKPLAVFLQRLFSEDQEGVIPALLDSARLKKNLLVVVRNHSTGSAWPLTNNPAALYNNLSRPDCNMKIPLWKIVRASTAAPVYFDPEEIVLGNNPHVFVDGAITPYNNPALIAALTALVPSYKMSWESGPDKLRIISVGTMQFSSALPENVHKLWVGYNAARIPAALIQGVAWQQDCLCRCLGKCIFGEELDSEIGDLVNAELPGTRLFSYVRYNKTYRAEELHEILHFNPSLDQVDAIQAIPVLEKLGREYAEQHVMLEHLI
jgi:uncharacterized protein